MVKGFGAHRLFPLGLAPIGHLAVLHLGARGEFSGKLDSYSGARVAGISRLSQPDLTFQDVLTVFIYSIRVRLGLPILPVNSAEMRVESRPFQSDGASAATKASSTAPPG